MELRTLRYFVYVAEAGSFSKASVHLRIAQPALSRQIRKLEQEIGVPLLLRTGRQLELTDAGRLLLSRGNTLIRQASQTMDEIRTFGSNLNGTVTIGISPAACGALAPLIVRACAARYPHLRLGFVEGFSGVIFDRLLNQELTLCILHNPRQHRAIDIKPLLVEAMYLVGPGRKGSGVAPVDSRTRLEDLTFILPNRPHALRLLIDQAIGKRINVAVQTDGFVTTMALVTAGIGYAILPYTSIEQELRRGEVSAARIDDLDIPWTLSLASRTDQRSVGVVLALSDIIRTQVEDLIATGSWGIDPSGRRIGARRSADDSSFRRPVKSRGGIRRA